MRWLIALTALLSLAPLARADEQFPRASISTNGDAIIYAKPDMVCASFGIETFDQNLDKAKQINDQASAHLVKAVKEVGVEERLLQVDTMTIELRYRGNGNPINGIEGYIARRYYRAELKDLKLLDKLVDAIIKNGANQFGGLEFRTSELRKHRDEARRMALKAAKEKADLMAKELGVTVGAPRTITEGGGYVGFYNRNMNSFGNAQQQAAAPAPAGDAGGEETMPLGQIAIQASVSVTFDLK
jgi:uncharacterized protein YggE